MLLSTRYQWCQEGGKKRIKKIPQNNLSEGVLPEYTVILLSSKNFKPSMSDSLSPGKRRFPFLGGSVILSAHTRPSLIVTVTIMLLVEKTLDLCCTAWANGTPACQVWLIRFVGGHLNATEACGWCSLVPAASCHGGDELGQFRQPARLNLAQLSCGDTGQGQRKLFGAMH